MVFVIGIGFIFTALAYFFGFIFIIYILENILVSLNNFLTILNENIPHINGLTIQFFFLILICAVIVLKSNGDMTEHKNGNNEIVYRKEWQKLLDIVNIAMIYPIFSFYQNTNFIGSTQKMYMIGYAVLFLLVYIFSHYYTYINNYDSKFDKICFYIHKTVVVISYTFIILLLLGIYSFFIYLHDFTDFKSIFISIIYYVLLIFPLIPFSLICFPSISKNEKIKAIISDFIFLIILSVILGFSSFYNLFIKNCSVYSIHSLIIIDIAIIVLASITLLPIKIIKANKEKLENTVSEP